MSIYQRGTATYKITSTAVQPGAVLLTTEAFTTIASPQGGEVYPASRKTDAPLRTVKSTRKVLPGRYERVRRVVVEFTDGTHSSPCAPSQTWTALVH